MMFLGYTKYDMELYCAIKIYVQGHLNGDCEIMSYAAKNSYRPNLYSLWLILSKHLYIISSYLQAVPTPVICSHSYSERPCICRMFL